MKTIFFDKIKLAPAALLLLVLASCGKPKDLKFGDIHDVSVKSMSLNSITLQGLLPIENPNSFRIKVTNANIGVFADSKEIARVKQTDTLTLDGNSKGDRTINATLSLTGSNLFSLMGLMNKNVNIDIDGAAHISRSLFSSDVKVHQAAVQDQIKPLLSKMKLF